MGEALHKIITLTGDLGSGKSKTGKLISAQINFEYLSTGDIQRKLASEMGLTTLELNKLAETDPEIDQKIDSIFIGLKDTDKNLVIDSRMAWHFLPISLKVLLKADIDITTQRVIHDKIRKNESTANPDFVTIKKSLIERKKSETKRFIEKYNADGTDLNNFDLVVETSYISAEDVARIIIGCYEKWAAGRPFNKYWFSPIQLIPLSQSLDIDCEKPLILKTAENYFIVEGALSVKMTSKSGLTYLSADFIDEKKFMETYHQDTKSFVMRSVDPDKIKEWTKELQITLPHFSPFFFEN